MTGILEGIIKKLENKIIENNGVVDIHYIADFIRELQQHEYDAHVCIMGQNGNGKSITMLALMKLLDENSIKNGQIVYAYDTTSRLVSLLRDMKSSVIGIDEAKKFFHYKLGMTTEQIVLTNMIEYARENKNAFIVCTNDIRRLNNNYRNAKVQLVIWLLDRFEDGDVKSYGLVFVGNPALEEEDKFQMNAFANLYSFESIRLVAEGLPTFFGYLFIDDIETYITPEELNMYRENKKKGIIDAANKSLEKLAQKEAGLLNAKSYEAAYFNQLAANRLENENENPLYDFEEQQFFKRAGSWRKNELK